MPKLTFQQKIKQFFCFFHSFTSQIQERGGKPDMAMIEKVGAFRAFMIDSRMYCKKCGFVPQITLDALKRGEEIDKRNITEKEKLATYMIGEITRPIKL